MRTRATLAFCLIVSGSLIASCAKPKSAKPDFHGRDLVVAGKYEEAIEELNDYLQESPQGRFASRASLFLGKAYLALGDLNSAQNEFERTIKKYPATLEAHKSHYKLALIAMLRGEKADARLRFAKIAKRADGPLAPEARAMESYLAPQDVN